MGSNRRNKEGIKMARLQKFIFWYIAIITAALIVITVLNLRVIKLQNESLKSLRSVDYRILHKQYPRLDYGNFCIIKYYAEKRGLSVIDICAIIDTESNFRPRATSHKGAKGLMQLMDGTAAWHGIRNSYDIDENIRGGVAHYAFCLSRADYDKQLAFMYYHAGHNRKQFPRESYDYAFKIICKIDLTNSMIDAMVL